MDFSMMNRRSGPKKKFTPEEDERLRQLVGEFGEFEWEKIASMFPNRNPRQCHDRWKFYLNPKINKTPFTKEEDWLLINLVCKYGGMWVQISKHFKNRSDVQMKNRWKALQKEMQRNISLCYFNQPAQNAYANSFISPQPQTYNCAPAIEKVSQQVAIPDDSLDLSFDSNIFGIDTKFFESCGNFF